MLNWFAIYCPWGGGLLRGHILPRNFPRNHLFFCDLIIGVRVNGNGPTRTTAGGGRGLSPTTRGGGISVARTDPLKIKHRTISFFLLRKSVRGYRIVSVAICIGRVRTEGFDNAAFVRQYCNRCRCWMSTHAPWVAATWEVNINREVSRREQE